MQLSRFALPFEQGLVDMPTTNTLILRPVELLGLDIFPNDTVIEQGLYPLHNRFEQQGYSVTTNADGKFDFTLVHLTRNKAENLGNIARAARLTKGIVMVDGAKTDGIESVLKQVKKVVPVAGVISKFHGKVFWFESAAIPDWEEAAKPSQNEAGFLTAPGMFSSKKPDQGSVALAPYLTDLKGGGADLGAGWGWLSKQVLVLPEVSKLDLFETDYDALEAAKTNLDDPRAVYHWADVTGLTKKTGPFDFVISNPPFHQTRKADPDLGKAFIQAAATILKPSGKFLMVANRQLPYEATLEQYFKKWTTLFQDGQFKVFEAMRPRK